MVFNLGPDLNFLQWVDEPNKSIIDTAARRFIITKIYEEAYELMEKLPSNHHQMVYDKIVRNLTPETLQKDAFTILSAQL